MTVAETHITPARQAERILAAWATGNEPLLQQELQQSQKLAHAPGQSWDEERLELLMAASEGMLRARAGRKDPSVRRCLDLLAHLAQTPRASSASN